MLLTILSFGRYECQPKHFYSIKGLYRINDKRSNGFAINIFCRNEFQQVFDRTAQGGTKPCGYGNIQSGDIM